MASPHGVIGETGMALGALADAAAGLFRPRLRLGVTGLSRSGKTVFITALVHALIEGGRLPVFRAQAEGRIRRVHLVPQPDDTVPRFSYETNLAALTGPDRHWPDSTKRISELRLEIEYESPSAWLPGPRTLTLDLVDYPGEWLLDLPLLETPFGEFCRDTLAAARAAPRAGLAAEFLVALSGIDRDGPADEGEAERLSGLFKAYLRAARAEPHALSLLPPGRFLMPGDLEGSPALTFAPVDIEPGAALKAGSFAELMRRRYDAYRREVVGPFFRDHFARLDRQIVLVDALGPLNAGPAALADLETALDRVLAAFRTGRNSLLSALVAPRVERVMFAATKADHLHHRDHDRLEAILGLLVERAMQRAQSGGAGASTVALAAVRATREASVKAGRQTLEAIVGTPQAGERVGDDVFDGATEAAIYPGELPAEPEGVFDPARRLDLRFVRFRPPLPQADAAGRAKPLPHIRLDRALEFLIGDALA
jgi:predicted YcjX-like family ATPase